MYDVPTLGINYRMSDINASIGREQLKRIDAILEARRTNFEALKQIVAQVPDTMVLDVDKPEAQQSWYCLTVVLEGVSMERRNAVIKALNAAGVGTSIYYPQPVPRLTYYRNKYNNDLAQYPNAARISDQSIALPVGPHLQEGDIAYIGAAFERIIKEKL